MDKRKRSRIINKILFGDRRYKPENRGGILTPLVSQGDSEQYEVIVKKKSGKSCSGCGCLLLIILLVGIVYAVIEIEKANNQAQSKKTKVETAVEEKPTEPTEPAKASPVSGSIQELKNGRIWTNRKDGRTITAEFIEYKNGKATVLRDNGKTVSIPLNLLSDEDREYIKSVRKEEKEE